MRFHRLALAVALAAFSLASAAQGGSAQVRFSAPERFTDAETPMSRGEALRMLAADFQRAAARVLPAGQQLEIDVLDVDLAGNIVPPRRGVTWVRVLRGGLDAPKLSFHYRLLDQGQVLREGEVRLTDVAYREHDGILNEDRPLFHERRLIERWVASEFGPH